MRARCRPWLLGGLLAVAVCASASADDTALTSLLKPLNLRVYSAGTMAPQFSGRTLDARQFAVMDMRGKVIVLNFWASWCAECRPEMPVLERLHRELAPRGLAVIGVNAREEGATVQSYAKGLGLTFPLVLDPDGKINAAYGVIGLPATFVVGRDGRAIAFGIGPREWASAPARALFETLLAEPAPRLDAR